MTARRSYERPRRVSIVTTGHLVTAYTWPAVATESAMTRLTDAELVQRCRQGSTDAWNGLVERFSRYVYAICSRGFGLGPDDAEDAFQEVFTRVYARLD